MGARTGTNCSRRARELGSGRGFLYNFNFSQVFRARFERARRARARIGMTRFAMTLLAITSLSSFVGCAAAVSPYARVTAGRIGCPAQHIELTDLHDGDGAPQSWVAQCGGHAAYACSSNGDPRRPQTRVICSEIGAERPRALSWAPHPQRHTR
jgi:hypothetical protein